MLLDVLLRNEISACETDPGKKTRYSTYKRTGRIGGRCGCFDNNLGGKGRKARREDDAECPSGCCSAMGVSVETMGDILRSASEQIAMDRLRKDAVDSAKETQ